MKLWAQLSNLLNKELMSRWGRVSVNLKKVEASLNFLSEYFFYFLKAT